MALSAYYFTVTHIPGKKSPANPLSRCPDYNDSEERDLVRQAGLPEFVSSFQGGSQDAATFNKMARLM